MITVEQVTRNVKVAQDRRDITVRPTTRNINVHTVGRRGPEGVQGEQGPQGIQGIQGIPGLGDKNYVSEFTNSSVVTVTHSLSKYPAVTITDSTGDEVEGEVEHVSVNQLITRFSASFTGRIICN